MVTLGFPVKPYYNISFEFVKNENTTNKTKKNTSHFVRKYGSPILSNFNNPCSFFGNKSMFSKYVSD